MWQLEMHQKTEKEFLHEFIRSKLSIVEKKIVADLGSGRTVST